MFRTTFDREQKQWNGLKLDTVFNPKTSLGNVILNVMHVNGPRVAQICAKTNQYMTYQEMREKVICVATNLRSIGCRKGDIITFVTYNSGDIAVLVCAALCLGCTITAQPSGYTAVENFYFFNMVKPDFVFCDRKEYTMLRDCLANTKNDVKIFTFDGQIDDSFVVEYLFQNIDADPHFVPEEINGETDVAFIVTTSGTTGNPKGVCITHAAVLDKMRRLSDIIAASDVLLAYSDLSGVSGIRFYMGAILNGAARIANQGSYSPERFLELIENFRVTYTLTPAFRTLQLLNHPQLEFTDMSSIRHYTSGGAKLHLDTVRKMNRHLTNGKLCQSFGMSESGGTIALNLSNSPNDSVGQLISGCQAKIIDEHGNRLGPNEIGELCFKLPYMFGGYIYNQKTPIKAFDDEGFFLSGDIAHFDESGDLFIVDRKRELFKSDGDHVIPSEIEGFLNEIDGVKHSCLVPIPDPKGDHLPAVVIVKSENSKCTEQSIFNAVLKSFAPHKRLRGGVYFVKSLPTTSSNKIARRAVAQMAIEFYNNKLNEKSNNIYWNL